MSRYYKDLLYNQGDQVSLPRRKHFRDSPVRMLGAKSNRRVVREVDLDPGTKYPAYTDPGCEVCPWELLPYE